MTKTYFEDFTRLDDAQTPVTVEYSYEPGSPATWDDPGDGPQIVIVSATVIVGDLALEAELTEAEIEHCYNQISQKHEADCDFGDDSGWGDRE